MAVKNLIPYRRGLFYRRQAVPMNPAQSVPTNLDPLAPVPDGHQAASNTNAAGELKEDEWYLVGSAMLRKQRATKPIEIIDGGTFASQMQYFIETPWTSRISKVDTACILLMPDEDKLYEVVGNAYDPDGRHCVLNLYVVDNVTRYIEPSLLPRELPIR